MQVLGRILWATLLLSLALGLIWCRDQTVRLSLTGLAVLVSFQLGVEGLEIRVVPKLRARPEALPDGATGPAGATGPTDQTGRSAGNAHL